MKKELPESLNVVNGKFDLWPKNNLFESRLKPLIYLAL